MTPAEAFKAARQAMIAEIEKAAADDKTKHPRPTSSRSTRAGSTTSTRFKKYTDVRLVFAPEQQIAFFGGDPDNFEYPRYDLDMCFFRVYENDKPVKIEHYLKWSTAGRKDDELVFVSGHPGRTNRLNTVAELEYLRDTGYPYLLQRLNRLEVLLESCSGAQRTRTPARPRTTSSASRTAARPASAAWPGCWTRSSWAARRPRRSELRDALAKDPEAARMRPGAWDTIAKAQKARAPNDPATLHPARRRRRRSTSQLVRHRPHAASAAAEELPKPNGERLPRVRRRRPASR